MRWVSTILAAISSVLLVFVLYFGARSYWRYEGIVHYSTASPMVATATGNGLSLDREISGRTSGLISFKGQLTYVSIANPDPEPEQVWYSWSHSIDQPLVLGPMVLVVEARGWSGLKGGTQKTVNLLRDTILGIAWRLPYDYFTVPYWMLAVAFAVGPYFWFSRYRLGARREAKGLCVRCGKSVAGLTGKCPACGEPIPA
jgi:hypothetical protein